MSTNPFRHHTNSLFASRGCDIDAAIAYANELITAMPTEQHIHATTALMVVVNTAANAFDQARGPSPERLALLAIIDERIEAKVTEALAQLDNTLDSWVQNSLSFEDACDSRIESWIENNLDVSSQVEDALIDMDLRDKIEGTISDLDLVVRIR